jgi:hypothetical protein
MRFIFGQRLHSQEWLCHQNRNQEVEQALRALGQTVGAVAEEF